MTTERMSLGPTGTTVRENVRRLREGQNLTFAELSRRLEAIGRPMPALGLRRLEAGQRRVDADDLTALAVALGTSPTALLMPDSETAARPLLVTGRAEGVRPMALWSWLRSEHPLPPRTVHSGDEDLTAVEREQFDQFRTRSVPLWARRNEDHHLMVAARDLEGLVIVAISADPSGDLWINTTENRREVAGAMRLPLSKLSRMADRLDAGEDVRDGWPSWSVDAEGDSRGER